MRKTYEERKEEVRQEAIEYYSAIVRGDIKYMSEFAEWGTYFRKLGKRYGLIREFIENGII